MIFLTSFFSRSDQRSENDVLHSLAELDSQAQSKPIPVYIHPTEENGDEKIQETVLGLLGEGGSKRAYALENGNALLMPRFESISDIQKHSQFWSDVIDKEVDGTKRVKELGCLACDLKRVDLFMTPNSKIKLPAYETEAFDHLASRGIWIIDTKNEESSTWNRSLFQKNSDRFDVQNWEKILDPFLKDLTKLLIHNVWLYPDNTSMAVIKKTQADPISNYEVRYFGFDFSGNNCFSEELTDDEISGLAQTVIGNSLSILMGHEFGQDALEDNTLKLKEKLTDRCVKKVLCDITWQKGIHFSVEKIPYPLFLNSPRSGQRSLKE